MNARKLGPGEKRHMPLEEKLSSRVYFKAFGHWPKSVVNERLANISYDSTAVDAILREIYRKAEEEAL